MRRLLVFAVILVVSGAVFAVEQEAEDVRSIVEGIENAELREQLLEELEENPESDLSSIGLDGLNDLGGLEELANIETLGLAKSQEVDMSPVSELPSLGCLMLFDCTKILWNSDSLNTSCEVLVISKSDLKEIDFVSKLPNLKMISIRDSSVNDLSSIKALKGLRILSLKNFKGQKNLAFIGEMTSLKGLTIKGVEALKFPSFSKLRHLEWLDIADANSVDVRTINSRNTLRELYLKNDHISNISFLKRLPNIEIAHLDDNPIKDFRPLSALKKLKNVSLSNTGFSDFKVLGGMSELETVYAEGNGIASLDDAEELIGIKSLRLRNNKLKSLAGIKVLSSLTSLDVRDNRLSSIEEVAHLKKLGALCLSGNKIKSIAPVAELSELWFLQLDSKLPNMEEAQQVIGELRERNPDLYVWWD
ncbi:Internalin-A precursor [Anaerohalosphaera lusitana]|uniref:Internalin-A n=1 Tax=Anaerohalosphaera lusitana TaxID=1936003 RepID=A0A1U9NIU6_9BACT|nr:leucine-rich repeat domain-containing protein [Anaerohalosphaera lusitana]AQT67853.1 Internalin-A precursor [Anaerohalosphaera lusitana]